MKGLVFTRLPENFDEEFLNSLRQSELVGIHGRNYSGKTELAKELVSRIGGKHISVDDYLSTSAKERTYLENVKSDKLIKKIQKSTRPVFLDCFIVLDVLEKINMQADYLIFCDRLFGEERFSLKQKNERAFDLYEERRNPLASAYKVFTFNFMELN